jgi:DnaJ family protein A protein 2
MRDGQKIIFDGESDERLDVKAGDIVFQLEQKEHDLFERDGIHLYMKKKISFFEALTGISFKIKHLDGRVLLVDHKESINPFSVKQITNEGIFIC